MISTPASYPCSTGLIVPYTSNCQMQLLSNFHDYHKSMELQENMIRKKSVQDTSLKRSQRKKKISILIAIQQKSVIGKYFADKEFHIVLVRRKSTQSEVSKNEGPAVLHIRCCNLSDISKYLLGAHVYYPFSQHLVIYQERWQERRRGISYALISQFPHTA